MPRDATLALLLVLSISPATARAAEHHVGPGRSFATIEAAVAKAKAGDAILVHPRANDAPYEKVAVRVRLPRITIRSAAPAGSPRVRLSGEGYDYSGVGSVPRAIVQFDPEAHHGTLAGFEIFGARNASHNGSGVRINGPNHVTIEDCEIRHNQMGIMSGGDGTPNTGADQLIAKCDIHHNGAADEPGFSHNLYVMGTSVRLRFCEVHHSTAGHNLKSRASVVWVEYSYIHDSANREVDLVDAADTERPGSDAVLLGNVIAKDPNCKGNRTVIHFGQDGGRRRDGAIHLIHNTIATPFIGPVVEVSGGARHGQFRDNIVWDYNANQRNQVLAAVQGGTPPALVGGGNVMAPYFNLPPGTPATILAPGVDRKALATLIPNREALLQPAAPALGRGEPAAALRLPTFPTAGDDDCCDLEPLSSQYRHPAGGVPRTDGKAPARGPFARP
jgi:hypothetical protein